MSQRKVGVAMAIGGAVLAAVGVTMLVRRRDQGQLQGALAGRAAPRHRVAPVVGRKKSGDMTVTIYADRDMPIDMRVGIIQDLVKEGLEKGEVRELARAIVGTGRRTVRVGKYDMTVVGAGCSSSDARCKADAIGRWTAANVRYSGDVAPVKKGRSGPVEAIDYFQTARRTIEMGGGDCDDNTSVNCTLLEEVGVPCRHRITAARPMSDWGHIYTMAEAGNTLLALDTTLPGYRTGKQARHARKIDFAAVRGDR
jgi:hypothetical protein